MPDTNLDQDKHAARPVVAIIGRQNVGKSTLLNRIAGTRQAIVADLPGTTRDRILAYVNWQGKDFTLVDTGGLLPGLSTGIEEGVNQQVRQAVKEADLVLFVTDTSTGAVPADEEVADWLRKAAKPVILVANKADNLTREEAAVDLYRLGIGDPVAVSAYHGTGIYDLLDRIISMLPQAACGPAVPDQALKLAIVGRPNVGKSMLVNRLLGQERVIVSDIPGTTRDAIDTLLYVEDRPVVLIDTAGIKRRGKVGRGVDKYSVIRSLRAIDRSDVAVLLLDAAEPATAQDTHVASFIEQAGKGVMIAVNKWDLISGVEQAGFSRFVYERFKFAAYAPVVFISAKTGKGVDKLVKEAEKIREERRKRIPTGELNGFIERVAAGHPPPKSGRKVLKIYYVTQAGIEPPTFVFFVNDYRLVHFSYQRYLENRLRQVYGFEGTPIKMNFKNRGSG